MKEFERLEENHWELLDHLEDAVREYERAFSTYNRFVPDDIGVDDDEYYNEDYGDGEDSPYELAVWVSETKSEIEDVIGEIKDEGYDLNELRRESQILDKAMTIIDEEDY